MDSNKSVSNVDSWNWGAFMYSPVFLIAHKSYSMGILSLILMPMIGLIWMIVCGLKGVSWAKETCELSDEAFAGSMETWNRAGIFSLILMVLTTVLIFTIVFLVLAAGFSAFSSDSDMMDLLQQIHSQQSEEDFSKLLQDMQNAQ